MGWVLSLKEPEELKKTHQTPELMLRNTCVLCDDHRWVVYSFSGIKAEFPKEEES